MVLVNAVIVQASLLLCVEILFDALLKRIAYLLLCGPHVRE